MIKLRILNPTELVLFQMGLLRDKINLTTLHRYSFTTWIYLLYIYIIEFF